MLESKIEKTVCDYAKSKGWLVYKFVSPNNRGVPDRLLLGPDRKIAFIEFKAPGKEPTKLQKHVFSKIRALLFKVYVIDNIEEGKNLIDTL
jgi:hypothetical protein